MPQDDLSVIKEELRNNHAFQQQPISAGRVVEGSTKATNSAQPGT